MDVAATAAGTAAPASSEGVVAAGVYVDGRRVANIAIEEASNWRSKPGHVVWIGLHEPDMALLSSVQRQFELHDLAIEDADHAHQRPKIEQYGDALFIVARTAQLDGSRIAFGETHLFVGEGYIVSVRHGASTSYKSVRERCESLSSGAGPGRGLHPLRHPRLHRRQLLPRARNHSRGGRGDGSASARQRHDAGADRAPLYAPPRPVAAAQCGWAPGGSLPPARARRICRWCDPRCSRCFAMSRTTSGRCRSESTRFARCWRFAFEASLLVGQAQETAVSKKLARHGSPSSRSRRRSPASTA